MYARAHQESHVSSRIEDLRDLARMLDDGKISQQEYDMVKADLLAAPADEWLLGLETIGPGPEREAFDGEETAEKDEGPSARWLAMIVQIPMVYRAALVGGLLVLIVGVFIATGSDAAGTVSASPRTQATTPASPPPGESLGFTLDQLSEGWNRVVHAPLISGGITASPEPGPLDSFLHRFNDSAYLAGAYDPSNGHVTALMVSASLHYEAVPNLYVHLCYLLHPGSQECLEVFVEETGLFGKKAADLLETEHTAAWEFEGHQWRFEIAADVETIRVQAVSTAD
jgi:hypothetical protein